MTQKEFELLNNERRAKMSPPHHAVTFPLTKRKKIKKRVDTYKANEHRIPQLIHSVPSESKEAPDTGMKRKLFKAVWEYYMGTELKGQSSEGNYRKEYTDENGIFHKAKRVFSANSGMSDLKGGYNGKEYHIEQKHGSEPHLDSQADYAEWVRSFGGIYITARTFDDIYDITQRILTGQPLDKYFEIRTVKHRVAKGPLFG